ncbi:hypothetical protein BLOT_007167 [Blomia tropicalis]|nr:hypothetical protein BLOT_007167 [Blomia tropicalis]
MVQYLFNSQWKLIPDIKQTVDPAFGVHPTVHLGEHSIWMSSMPTSTSIGNQVATYIDIEYNYVLDTTH